MVDVKVTRVFRWLINHFENFGAHGYEAGKAGPILWSEIDQTLLLLHSRSEALCGKTLALEILIDR